MSNYTVLVNSSDGYEDCWGPFFQLFARYWPTREAPVMLNTERADWRSPDVDLECTRSAADKPSGWKGSWSECLDTALSRITTPLVLYLQEDYFFQAPVAADMIDEIARKMIDVPAVRHVGLTHFGAHGPFLDTPDPRLWEISKSSRYRLSTQAGLWRVETLRSYLEKDENGWMFEIFGTLRARHRSDLFLTVNRNLFGPQRRVIDYPHTGIVKGRWHPQMPQFFERHGITMDCTKRGFYRQPPWLLRKIETATRLLSSPRACFRALRESARLH